MLLLGIVIVTRTASREAGDFVGRDGLVVPRVVRVSILGLGVMAEVVLVCVASLARIIGMAHARLGLAPTLVYGRCLEGPTGSFCHSVRVLGLVGVLEVANVRLVEAVGASPPATRRSSQAFALGLAGAVGLAASVASTAICYVVEAHGPGKARPTPFTSLGA